MQMPSTARSDAGCILQETPLQRGKQLGLGRNLPRHDGRVAQGRDAHAQQADFFLERHAPQAIAAGAQDGGGIRRGAGQGDVARHRAEILEAQLDAHRAPRQRLLVQVARHARAQAFQLFRQGGAVAHHLQIALEGGFAADGLGFPARLHGPLVDAQRRLLQPARVQVAELRAQHGRIGPRQLADGIDAQRFQLGRRLRPDAVDLFCRQGPHARGDILGRQDGQAVRFFQVGTDFCILLQSATNTQ